MAASLWPAPRGTAHAHICVFGAQPACPCSVSASFLCASSSTTTSSSNPNNNNNNRTVCSRYREDTPERGIHRHGKNCCPRAAPRAALPVRADACAFMAARDPTRYPGPRRCPRACETGPGTAESARLLPDRNHRSRATVSPVTRC
ncbi:hypothetical protein CgunFtcFv8_015148 [Champsocephalus gunnari]|uniref:Uncharacterized protein n=1 Tax=Champsocephalus gunnari TaxID=52237 RepID=A0AAN8C628_CHAGU|nr:hypothetical protein CgunFtcFv8_015148 [Champsocephalus gunnari]